MDEEEQLKLESLTMIVSLLIELYIVIIYYLSHDVWIQTTNA